MKTVFLASVAAATLIAAPALAQDAVGSVGVAYDYTDVAGEEVNGATIDGVVATPAFGDWTVTFNAAGSYSDAFGEDETTLEGAVHLTKKMNDVRVGGYVGASEFVGTTVTTFGAEAQKYFDRATLTGVASYSTVADADIWTLTGDAAFYATPDLRLNVGATYSDLELDSFLSGDAWSVGVGAEYQFAGTPYSVFGGYDYVESDDLGLEADVVKIGLRYNFGGGLQARDQAGASLDRTAGTLLSLLGN